MNERARLQCKQRLNDLFTRHLIAYDFFRISIINELSIVEFKA